MRLIDQPLPGLEHVTEVRQIERDFAGAWHVWISSAGRWWATRRGRDARWGRDTPPMTVDADDGDGLRAELANWSKADAPGPSGTL
jgi:hypothetical protein